MEIVYIGIGLPATVLSVRSATHTICKIKLLTVKTFLFRETDGNISVTLLKNFLKKLFKKVSVYTTKDLRPKKNLKPCSRFHAWNVGQINYSRSKLNMVVIM